MKNDILRAAYLLTLTSRVNSKLHSCTFQSVSSMFLRMEFWKLNANNGGYIDAIKALMHDDLIAINNRGLFLPNGTHSYQTLDKSDWTIVVSSNYVYASPEIFWDEFWNMWELPKQPGELIINLYGMCCGIREHEFITITDKGKGVVCES